MIDIDIDVPIHSSILPSCRDFSGITTDQAALITKIETDIEGNDGFQAKENTCIGCGLTNARNLLNGVGGSQTKFIVLLTDGQNNE